MSERRAGLPTGRGTPFGARERTAPAPRAKGTAAKAQKSPVPSSLDAPYAALARTFASDPRVTLPSAERGKFGSNGLKIDGKIFAMWVGGALVVKLPRSEVDAAVAAGRGERLAMGAGRTMKEWLVVREAESRWAALARRAAAFVAAAGRGANVSTRA